MIREGGRRVQAMNFQLVMAFGVIQMLGAILQKATLRGQVENGKAKSVLWHAPKSCDSWVLALCVLPFPSACQHHELNDGICENVCKCDGCSRWK